MNLKKNEDNEATKRAKRISFELLRRNQKDIEIVTYDEIFERIKDILNIIS